MFNSPKDNFGLYEGNPLLRKESSQNGFGKTFKVSSERLKKRNRKWKYLLVLSFFVDCAVSPQQTWSSTSGAPSCRHLVRPRFSA